MRRAVAFGVGLLGLFLLIPAPASVQQDPPRPSCCADIYLTGYYLGLAASLAGEGAYPPTGWPGIENKITESDMDYFQQFINNAGLYLERAHSNCSLINPAWPDWKTRRAELLALAARVRKDDRPSGFRQPYGYLAAARESFAWALQVEIGYDRETFPPVTCAEKYFKVGYDIGQAQGCAFLASHSNMPGHRIKNNDIADGVIQRARDDLNIMTKIEPRGRCAPLWEILALLSDWQVAYDKEDQAERNYQLLRKVNEKVRIILSDCISMLGRDEGGGGGTGDTSPSLASVIGTWSYYWIYDLPEEPYEQSRSPIITEFYNYIGKKNYATSRSFEWRLEGNDLWLFHDNGWRWAVFTLQSDGSWAGHFVKEDLTYDEVPGHHGEFLRLVRVSR